MARKKTRAKPASLKTPPKVTKADILAAKRKDEANKETSEKQPEDSAVVCLSHIPHGFFEGQMRKYFSQFGQVKRLRLSRSKKSGRSRGFAFIEFEFPEVAKVVAETMNGYLTYQKIMKCRVIPTEKIHPQLFKGCDEKFKKPWHREASKNRHNSLLTAAEDRIHIAQKRRVQLERRRNKKLEELGIAFKSDILATEWENLKGPVKGSKSRKSKQSGKKKGPTPQKQKRRKTEDDESSPSPKKVKASGEESEDEGESNEEESFDDSDIVAEFDSSSDDDSADNEELDDSKPKTGQKKSPLSANKSKEFTSLKKEKGPPQDKLTLSAKKAKPSTPQKGIGEESLQRKSNRSARKTKASTPLKKDKELLQEKSTPSTRKAKLTTPYKKKEAMPDESTKKTKLTPFKKSNELAQEKSSVSAKKAKLNAPSKEKELLASTPKSVTKGKTPRSAKKGSKVSHKPKIEAEDTPVAVKTPKKVTESGKKVPKTPKSGKVKTPKSGGKKK
ncbi:uncharacterized protein [Amphiura filiformis]|uniref:uncharacterized protein n=1 Tax=Amphiura filiformis TaxID=82378 RepID=UPI003B21396B